VPLGPEDPLDPEGALELLLDPLLDPLPDALEGPPDGADPPAPPVPLVADALAVAVVVGSSITDATKAVAACAWIER
jgi:hypothetical protein